MVKFKTIYSLSIFQILSYQLKISDSNLIYLQIFPFLVLIQKFFVQLMKCFKRGLKLLSLGKLDMYYISFISRLKSQMSRFFNLLQNCSS